MTRICLLGSGNVARALARPLAAHGHTIVVGSRKPESLRWPDAGVRAATLHEAAGSSDVVINALPGDVSTEVLAPLGPALRGKVLIDVANAVRVGSDGFAAELLHPGSSLAEQIQLLLPETAVVKALNTMHVSLMAEPHLLSGSPAVFVSGDVVDAKRATTVILSDLGWLPQHIFDLGAIDTARWSEGFALMIRPLINTLGPVPFGLAVAH